MPRAPRRPGSSAPSLSDLPELHRQIWLLQHRARALFQELEQPGTRPVPSSAALDAAEELARDLLNATDYLKRACRELDLLTPYT